MLQRVYGTAWATQDELDQYLWRREEARKRDHRRLGVQLDLFSFHDVSPGSAFWHPKGQPIWRTLETAMRELQERRGYQEVSTPIVVSERLWRQSGHWDLYRDNMFLIESEGQTFSLKPMNCPESTFIYRSNLRSYRDLPLRYNEYGRLHRNERSGTLSGLTRVRQFIQDDAHLYVRPDQLTDEIEALLGEVREAYGWFGLEPRFAFATKPDKALGDPASGSAPRSSSARHFAAADIDYVIKPKDGTFYAPKIDIYIDDALGREWQMATIQVDLVDAARAVRPDVHRRERPAAAPDRHPSRHLRFARAVHRHPHRAFRRRVPALDRARPGRRHPDRRPPHRARPTSSPASCERAGLRVEVDALGQPDAEQDPARPGTEGPVHARPRRPGGRGSDRRPTVAQRGTRRATGRDPVGRPRGSPGCRIGRSFRRGSRVGRRVGRRWPTMPTGASRRVVPRLT